MHLPSAACVKWILLALLSCGLAVWPETGLGAQSRSDAGQPGGAERAAVRHVLRHLPRSLRLSPRVACRRARGRRLAPHVCRWKAGRRLSPNRYRVCQGRWTVQRRKRRWVTRRRSKLRCALKVSAADPRLGFNDNSVPLRQMSAAANAALTERLGVGLSRVTLDWRAVERSRDRYDFSVYDEIYKELAPRGIRPLWVLAYAPAWARDPLALCDGACLMPPARSQLAEWAEVARLVASRYPKSAGIEVWNEPNENGFWRTGADPGRYAELLRVAHGAIKSVDPKLTVVSAGLSDRAERSFGGDIPLEEFLAGMLAQGGAQSADAIGVHIYPRRAGFPWLQRTLSLTRGIRDSTGARDKPIWVTESGLSTEPSPLGGSVDEAGQATGLLNMYRAYRGEADLGAWIFHTLVEPPRQPSSGFGLVRPDLSPKPAFCAFARELRTGGGCSY